MHYGVVPAFFATALTLYLHLASSVHATQRFALLIGNQNYKENVGKLTNPHNDVELIAESLRQLGFKVKVVKDARGDTFRKEIYDYVLLLRKAGPDTISFFYYSGHGASDDKTNTNYLIPVDVPDTEDASLWSNSLDIKADVIEKFHAQAPDAIQYVVFDACRSELRLKKGKAFFVGGKGFVPVEHQNPKILVAFSTAANRTASDTGLGSGPYARALAEELLRPDIEAVTMFRNVHLRVLQSTGQEPWLGVPTLPPVVLAEKLSHDLTHPDMPSREIIEAPDHRELSEIEAYNRERLAAYKTIERWGVAGGKLSEKRWRRSPLTICFTDGDIDRRRHVARIARQWTLYGKIDFDFGRWLEPQMCSRRGKPADIRITFGQKGDWSYVGTDSLRVTASDPTLSLESLRDASLEDIRMGKFDRTILHQFGHALGFNDRKNLPNFYCRDDEVNWGYVYYYMEKEYGWKKDQVNLFWRPYATPYGKAESEESMKAIEEYIQEHVDPAYIPQKFDFEDTSYRMAGRLLIRDSSIMDSVVTPDAFFLKESRCDRILAQTLDISDQQAVFINYP